MPFIIKLRCSIQVFCQHFGNISCFEPHSGHEAMWHIQKKHALLIQLFLHGLSISTYTPSTRGIRPVTFWGWDSNSPIPHFGLALFTGRFILAAMKSTMCMMTTTAKMMMMMMMMLVVVVVVAAAGALKVLIIMASPNYPRPAELWSTQLPAYRNAMRGRLWCKAP